MHTNINSHVKFGWLKGLLVVIRWNEYIHLNGWFNRNPYVKQSLDSEIPLILYDQENGFKNYRTVD
jgi:hypothetical protein